MRLFQVIVLFLLVTLPFAAVMADEPTVPPPVTAQTINAADLRALSADPVPLPVDKTTGSDAAPPPATPDPAIAKLQILLDRTGASPGVIDGFDGDNLRKAVAAFETMAGLAADGRITPDVIAKLETSNPVIGGYTITAEDVGGIVPAIPTDYAEMAKLKFLGYTSVTEELAERFHMDEDLLKALNPNATWAVGEQVAVAAYGPDKEGKVARLVADKSDRQLRGYDADGRLIVAYPATIGSTDNPSPTGTHVIDAIAPMPNYTYNPDVNFQQGDNTSKLIIPPGPNGPVGAMWIDLTDPTFGIHGTPEPSKIDKTNSHGCVRLTNWDATELSTLVDKGVPVDFVD